MHTYVSGKAKIMSVFLSCSPTSIWRLGLTLSVKHIHSACFPHQ